MNDVLKEKIQLILVKNRINIILIMGAMGILLLSAEDLLPKDKKVISEEFAASQYQQEMDGKAVDMEEIPHRHTGPVGEQQRQSCAGNGEIIQKASDGLHLLEGVKSAMRTVATFTSVPVNIID